MEIRLGFFNSVMGLNFYKQNNLLSKAPLSMWVKDAQHKFQCISPYLKKSDRILEIGTGLGTVSKTLIDHGFSFEGVDIADYSIYEEVKPTVYDGKKLPFKKNEFDSTLILTVLHHTKNPIQIISEAARVSKKVIIIEDIYSNKLQKYLTFFTDSLTNFEFKGHPHTNKTDAEWKLVFKKLDLKLINDFSYRYFLLYRQVVYMLERK
ncbi:MAG: methyltransferase domain-containing protein [Bacteroidota bacterium]